MQDGQAKDHIQNEHPPNDFMSRVSKIVWEDFHCLFRLPGELCPLTILRVRISKTGAHGESARVGAGWFSHTRADRGESDVRWSQPRGKRALKQRLPADIVP